MTTATAAVVAVLWLQGAPDDRVAERAELVDLVDRAVARGPHTRRIDDAEVRRTLVEGGPRAHLDALLADATSRFAAQHFSDADRVLGDAEELALRELSSTEIAEPLARIESLRVLCADFARDDVAAQHAARLLALLGVAESTEARAAAARHPDAYGPRAQAPSVRVESEPAGAEVYVDLHLTCTTPCELPVDRALDALVDVEKAGYRKIHRSAPGAGTLAVALAADAGIGRSVDRLRGLGDIPEAEAASLGRMLGAQRLLVARARGRQLDLRVLDVATGKWHKPAITITVASDETAREQARARVASYAAASELEPAASTAAAVTSADAKTPGAAASPTANDKGTSEGPAWKKWYTWVIGGGLIALVLGLVLANHIGGDQVTVHVTH